MGKLKSIKKENFNAEKLWESEESLRVLMNSNPEAVCILDTDGNFVAANEKTAQRFGKPVEELISTNVFSPFLHYLKTCNNLRFLLSLKSDLNSPIYA